MARRRISRRAAAGGGLIAAGLALLLVLAAAWTYVGPGPKARAGDVTAVTLAKGAGVRQIGQTLRDAGVISSPSLFALAARLTGAASQLKAGEYEVMSGASMAAILSDLRAGRVVRRQITIPEGDRKSVV
jgi:UPF0755 protein